MLFFVFMLFLLFFGFVMLGSFIYVLGFVIFYHIIKFIFKLFVDEEKAHKYSIASIIILLILNVAFYEPTVRIPDYSTSKVEFCLYKLNSTITGTDLEDESIKKLDRRLKYRLDRSTKTGYIYLPKTQALGVELLDLVFKLNNYEIDENFIADFYSYIKDICDFSMKKPIGFNHELKLEILNLPSIPEDYIKKCKNFAVKWAAEKYNKLNIARIINERDLEIIQRYLKDNEITLLYLFSNVVAEYEYFMPTEAHLFLLKEINEILRKVGKILN